MKGRKRKFNVNSIYFSYSENFCAYKEKDFTILKSFEYKRRDSSTAKTRTESPCGPSSI